MFRIDHRKIIAVAILLLTCSIPTQASTEIAPGYNGNEAHRSPIAVIQLTPGLHLGVSGGKFGMGLSVDALGGIVFGPRYNALSAAVVAGPFVEYNLIIKQGGTFTWGGRGGAGAVTPTLTGGFIPWGLATFDIGQSSGAHTGRRTGGHLRGLFGGAGVSKHANGDFTTTVGLELPMLPIPWID